MQKSFKKAIATFLVVLMLMTSVPLNGFVGMDWSFLASAAEENVISSLDDIMSKENKQSPSDFQNKFEEDKADFSEFTEKVKDEAENIFSFMAKKKVEQTQPVSKFSLNRSVAPASEETDFSWDYDEETHTLTVRGTGDMPDYTEMLEQEGVPTPIAPWAEYAKEIEKVVIEAGITSVGDCAFALCTNLKEVVLSEGITSIGAGAFVYCVELVDINLPSTLISVDQMAFGMCWSVEELVLPDSIETIGDMAFMYMFDLEKINLPASLQDNGEGMFTYALSLKELVVPEGLKIEAVYDVTEFLALSLEHITNHSTTFAVDISFGDLLDGYFDSIEYANAFSCLYKNYFKYEFTGEEAAMLGIEISEQELIEDTINYFNTNLGTNYAVADFENFEHILAVAEELLLSNLIQTYGYPPYFTVSCIENSKQHELCRDNAISHDIIGEDENCVCFAMSGTLGDNITWSVDGETKTLTFDGSGEMADCDDVPGYVKYSAYIENIRFAEGSAITSIGAYAFYGLTNVETITLPEGIITLGEACFYNSGVKTLNLPASLNSTDMLSFYTGTAPLEEINVAEGNEKFLSYEGSLYLEYVEYEGEMTYLLLKQPEKHADVFIDNTIGFFYCAFEHYSTVKQINVPDTVLMMTEAAFLACASLETINIGNSKIYQADGETASLEIEDDFVAYCNNLTAINVDEKNINYSSIDGVLYNKNVTEIITVPMGLNEVTVPETVTAIPRYAFDYDKLQKVTILNPDCEIRDESSAIYRNATICGYKDSTAEVYADKYNRNFEYIGDVTVADVEFDFSEVKKVYGQFSDIDTSGIKVTLTFSDGTTSVKTAGFNVSGFDSDGKGEQTVTVTYRSYSDTYTVTIAEPFFSYVGEFIDFTIEPGEVVYIGYTPNETQPLSLTFRSGTNVEYYVTVYEADKQTVIYEGVFDYQIPSYRYESGKTYYFALSHNRAEYGAYIGVELSLAHNYYVSSSSEATCTEAGYITYTCSDCGNSYTENTYALGHKDENADNICDTCEKEFIYISVGETKNIEVGEAETVHIKFVPEESGSYRFYSSGDGDTYGYLYDENMNQLRTDDQSGENSNFSIVYDFEVGKTYWLGAKYYYSYNSGSFDVTLECAHDGEWEVVTEATCEEDGLKKCICTQCGKEVTGEIERLYHNMTVISSTSATCTEQGTLVYDCTRCDYSYTSYITPYHTDSDGNRICEVCGKTSTYEVEFNVPESITLDTDYETLYAEFTPTFSGYYRLSSQLNDSNYHYVYFNVYKNGSYISSGYGYEGISCYLDQGETYTIHITGNKCTFDVLISCAHQGEWSVTTEPTCIEDGLEKRICTQCGDEETRAINRLWHTCEVISITPETCTEYGEEIYKCIRCDYGYTNLLDAHHTDDDDNGICEICDKKITYILELEKTESITLDTSKEILYAKFTPEINGNYNFGATFNENEDQNVSFYVTDSNGYYVNSGNGGYGGVECYLNAGETYTVKINGYGGSADGNSGTFDMLVSCCHDGDWIITKQPTCTENGEKERVCTKCGETETEVEWCLGHDYVRTTTKEPTCTEKGIETITCSRCTDVHEENEINKSIHTDDNNDYICEVCNNEIPHIIVGETKSLEVAEAELVYVKFIPTTSGLYRFYANASNDTYAYLYDADLNQISYDDDSGEDRNFLIEYDGFEAGEVYYFGVRYYYSYDSGAFDITLECGHIYSEEWTVDVEPTCTDEGSKSHHCTRCDEKNDITAVEPLGHNYGDWVITTEPTCIKTGVEKRNCSRCTDIESQAVDALGHNYSTEWTIDKEATCTEEGSKSHHCTRCDDKADITVIDAHGHTWGDWSVATEPTCTEKGEETRTCSVCKDTEKQDVSALGHDYSEEWTVDKEATCTKDGSKSHHCSRCDDKSDVTVIEKLGHAYGEWVVTTQPTCTKTGVEKRTCSRCGNVESQVVEALGHDYSNEWTVDKEATCTEDGSKSHHCIRCDDKADVTVIEKLGHAYSEWVVTIEPTCTKTGVEKRTCSRCGNVESQVVDALGHDYSEEWTVDKEATCTIDGSKSHHCTRCDDKTDVTVIEAHGHEYESVITEPTCTKDGYTTHTCSICEDTYTDTVVDALGHTYGEWVVTTEPTCIKTGVEKRTCSRCDNVESQTVEALGHDYSEEWTVDKESTCTEDGSKSHHCTRCDDKADVTALPKGEHKYKAFEVVYPTCTAQGYTKYRCSICKEVKNDDYEDAVGHSFGEWFKVNDPDCVNKGKSGHTCTVCNTTEYSYVDSLGHNWSKWSVSVEPTVLADGKETRNCSRCNKVETKTISKIEVDITENENYGLAHFTVVDAQTLEPIEGASIFISTKNDGENTFFTDAEGKVSIILPVGKQTIQAYAEGCHVRSLKVTINPGEQTLPNIGLSGDELVDAEVTVTEMTLEEILEAGIDVNAEDNKQYYKWSLTCKFDAVPEFIFEYVTDSEGNTYYTDNTDKKGPGYSIVITSEGEISSRNSQSTNVGVRPVVNLGLTGYSKGDKLNFGYYPQTQVTSESLIDSLNSQDIDWEVYEVYCGDGEDVDSSVITEIMYYADVEYNGSTYRAIKNIEYRPALTYTKANEYNSYQDNNGYYTDNVYWFKYEPISWIVLEQNADSVFVISENALDSQSRTVYKQDFELKEWLNNEFALTAFTTEERSKIITTKVSNCWCGEHSFTYEKLYFISEKDVALEDYGFQKYNEENVLVPNYEMLCTKGTDYSLALGIYDDTWEKNEYEAWWIRGLGEPSGSGGGGGGFGGGGGGFRGTGGNGTPFTIYPMGGGEEELFYLVIWGEVSWLKEMFDVEMVVINRSKTDTIENCVATLDIPDGLSLATMVGQQQTLAQNIGHIDSDSTETVHWYIRGDKEGNYNVKAKLEGTLMPFEEDFCYDYEAKDSVRVYAGSAMHMTFTIPDGAYEGHDAVVTIELENVSDKTLYNVSSKITDVFQFDSYYLEGDEAGLYYHTKGGEKLSWESGFAEKFEPGDKIILEVSTNILFHSRMYDKLAVEIGKIEKLKKMYDSLQALIDVSSGFIGLLDLASKNIDKVISEGAEIAGECYSALASEISKLYTKLDGMPESEVAQIAVTLINSDVWGVIEGISSGDWTPNMNDVETIIKTADKIKTIVEEKEDYDDPFGLIQDVISLLPVRYRLIDAYVETREGSTTEIPYTIETYHVESPYKGVINMGKIMMDTVITGMGEIDTGYFKIFGVSDPTGFKDSYNSLKTELGKLKALRVRAGVEDTRVKAWVVPAKAKTRSASLNAEDFFTLSITENDTAEIVNGVLEFTGNATLNVTALSEVGGTLYVDMGDGDVFEYEIEVVEEHECSSEEWVTLLSASKYSDSYQARYCDICDELIDYRSVEACEKHSFGEWTTESEANCTVGGVATRTCSSCGYEETSFIDATGHTEKTINKVDATCTADGYTGDVICEVCEETISVGEAVVANGHSYEAVITAPTCTADGYTTNTCSVCQDSYISDVTEKLGHTGGTANCEDKAICTVCGEAYGEINPDNHKNVVTDKAVSATCTSTGLTEGIHCDTCGKVIVAQTTTEKLSHTEEIIPAVNSTCTKTGFTEGKKCSACGEILVKQTETSKLEHSYKSVVTAPTCTNGGYTTYTCSVCKHAYKANETAKLGHNMGSFIVVEQPSCTENGLEIAECSRCDYSEVNELSASGHNYQDGVCTECGDSKSNNCSCNCHKTGFMGFIWKILRFFYKLFGMNKVCSCGVAHY